MQENTASLWDTVWEKGTSREEDQYLLAREENSIRWQRIEYRVLEVFGSFSGLRVIEIGAGAGTNAALMAKMGAEVTVLDYSEKALKRSKSFFDRNELKATYVQQDLLSLLPEYKGQYDISMSFGLTEHFSGESRIMVNQAHFDLLKTGGIAFISVPNKYNLPYRMYKFIAELIGWWKVGEEYPYTRAEFRLICDQIGLTQYSFFGDSFCSSFNFFNPIKMVTKLFKIKESFSIDKIKREKGTFLDQYISYALILFGKKG